MYLELLIQREEADLKCLVVHETKTKAIAEMATEAFIVAPPSDMRGYQKSLV
jgi:hypothetical protein